MKNHTSVILIGLTVSLSTAFGEKQPMTRYQSIIDRQMFGPLPQDFDPTKMPSEVSKSGSRAAEKELTKEQEQLQSSVKFSVINLDRNGKVVVGFSDNSDPKSPKHYYLRVGESRDGWLVKEADQEHATMTIVKDGIELAMTLGEDTSGKGGKKTAANGGQKPGLAAGAGSSLQSRRAARRAREEEILRKTQAEAAEREAARKAQAEEEKAQREAERAEQRQQLANLAEELRKVREARQKSEEAPKETKEKANESDNAE